MKKDSSVSDTKPRLVTVLGEYEHFLQSMLCKSFDFVEVKHSDLILPETDLVIFWNPWCALDLKSITPPLRPDATNTIINGGNFHDSKENVARVFEEVFGYELSINPTEYDSLMVRKSNTNAVHDGVTLKGPIEQSEVLLGYVYQKLVSNTLGPSVFDIRVSIVKGVQALCYLKFRPVADRYSNVNSCSLLAPTSVFLDSQEIELVNKFCATIELEFGQLDICRDTTTNRIYIVDANNTPFGPPNGMSDEHALAAIKALADDFFSAF